VIVGWIAPVPTVESNSSNEPGVLSISKEMVLAAVASTAPWMSSLPPLALIVPWPVSVALAAMVPNIVSTAPAPSSWIMPFEMFSAAPIVSLPLGPISNVCWALLIAIALGVVAVPSICKVAGSVGLREGFGALGAPIIKLRPLTVPLRSNFPVGVKPPAIATMVPGVAMFIDRAVTVEVGVAGERASVGDRASDQRNAHRVGQGRPRIEL
jgi:hypothetical protein